MSAGKVINIISRAFVSPDAPTRRMAWVFLLSCLSVIAATTYWVKRWITLRGIAAAYQAERDKDVKAFGEYLGKRAELAKQRYITVSLGTYNAEIKKDPNWVGRGGLNVAQIDIVAECDSKETAEYVEANLTRFSNQITNVLINVDRDELLSKDGKRRIQTLMIQKMNEILDSGKVERIYFTKLMIS